MLRGMAEEVAPSASITPDTFESICERHGGGESLTSILGELGVNWSKWFREVLRKDRASVWAQARENHGHARAQQIAQLADDVLDGRVDHKVANAAFGMLAWVASKSAPKHYSDKHQAVAGVQVVIASSLTLDGEAPQSGDISATYKAVSRPSYGSDDTAPEPARLNAPAKRTRKRSRKQEGQGAGPPDGSHPTGAGVSGTHHPTDGRTRTARKNTKTTRKRVPKVEYGPEPQPEGEE